MTTPAPWGLFPWGLGTWGSGAGSFVAPPQLLSAVATSTHTVLVAFTGNLQAQSALGSGDALNPELWILTRNDVPETIPVVAVRVVTEFSVFELATLVPLGEFTVEHTVDASNILDPFGSPLTPPTSFDFAGVTKGFTNNLPNPDELSDLRNEAITDGGAGGSLRVASSGDYEQHSGRELFRKLIIRRILTTPGEFFHMPEYGFGIAVKEHPLISDIGKLKSAVELSIQQDPEIEAVSVSISVNRQGIMNVFVRAKLRRIDNQIEESFAIPTVKF